MISLKKTLLTTLASTSLLGTGAVAMNTASAASIPPVLQAIRSCESGGNYGAQNPSSTASGAYQFLDTTWYGLEGHTYAHAKNAPAALQDAAALKLYAASGTSPWLASKGCWGNKIGHLPTTVINTTPAPVTTSHAMTSIHPVAPTQVSRSTQRRALITPTTTATTTTVTTTQTPTAPPSLGAPVRINPDGDAMTTALNAANHAIRHQSSWTIQAANGSTITRHVVIDNAKINLYDNGGAFIKNVAKPMTITGHYTSTDTFKITRGAYAGSYVNSAIINRLNDVRDGKMTKNQLVSLPSYLTAGKDVRVSPQTAKSLEILDASYYNDNGSHLVVSEGYLAKAHTSGHGLGLSVDIKANASTTAYLKTHAINYGFNFDAAYPWHLTIG